MKEILIVSNTSWSIYNFRYGLMKELKKSFDVSFCANYDNYTEKLKKEFAYHEINIDRKGKNPFKDLKLIFNLRKIYQKEKPGLIIHYTIKPNIYGTIAARMVKIKSINVVTGMGHVFVKNGPLSLLVRALYKLSFKFAEKTFFLNQNDLDFFVGRGLVKKEDALLLPGEGIDTEYFSPKFCEQKEDTLFTFLFLGRMLKEKGIVEIVETFKTVRDNRPCQLFLVGPIDKNNPLSLSEEEMRIWEKKGLVKYFSQIDDVRGIICQSDAIILPSYYKEGLPRSLLEAAAMEKPIIASDIPGCREVVEDKISGFLCRPKDKDDLADKMVKIMKLTKEERDEMGRKGRERVLKDFDERIIIQIYLDNIYKINKEI